MPPVRTSSRCPPCTTRFQARRRRAAFPDERYPATKTIALRDGGIELTGTVVDVTGGPIAGAVVVASGRHSADSSVVVRTDEHGRFAMWVGGDGQRLVAHADGYASGTTHATPPADVAIALTPEATFAGVVVDGETRVPVANARIVIQPSDYETPGQTTFCDARGEFRVRGLMPGRVQAEARTEHAFGHLAGSRLLEIGTHLTGAVVEVWPSEEVEDVPEETGITVRGIVKLLSGESVAGVCVLALSRCPRPLDLRANALRWELRDDRCRARRSNALGARERRGSERIMVPAETVVELVVERTGASPAPSSTPTVGRSPAKRSA